MINTAQEIEIVQYLISKKLEKKLLLEIKDHFMLQIAGVMENSHTDFEEAFLQTKMNWKNELELVKADLLSKRKMTRIEKDILQTRFKKMSVYALVFSLVFSGLLYMKPYLFNDVQIVFLVIIFGLSVYNFMQKTMNLNDYFQISFHPLLLKNLFAGIILIAIASFFFKDLHETLSVMIKPFFLFAAAIQIQLLYWNAKKINVLI
ncbi:hypothetical protein [Chryseobacterium vrystaatense]|uniref:Uncharacterized protein n=1 Tax=Chryseobacterium vrystaatense TaxID=307480 RepID=A0A1M5LSQ3_9FLAO|nr:hypothetical protein [Chryseobacterium vrystaatense]SHG67649.1 hypothetical protein SAMN02787073_4632 [Chryseobacterium vrystaatense]